MHSNTHRKQTISIRQVSTFPPIGERKKYHAILGLDLDANANSISLSFCHTTVSI